MINALNVFVSVRLLRWRVAGAGAGQRNGQANAGGVERISEIGLRGGRLSEVAVVRVCYGANVLMKERVEVLRESSSAPEFGAGEVVREWKCSIKVTPKAIKAFVMVFN